MPRDPHYSAPPDPAPWRLQERENPARGRRIVEGRKEIGLSRNALSKRTAISNLQLTHYESGWRIYEHHWHALAWGLGYMPDHPDEFTTLILGEPEERVRERRAAERRAAMSPEAVFKKYGITEAGRSRIHQLAERAREKQRECDARVAEAKREIAERNRTHNEEAEEVPSGDDPTSGDEHTEEKRGE